MRWAAIALAAALALSHGPAWAQSATAGEAIDRFLVLNAESRLQTEEGRLARTAEAAEWDMDTAGPLPSTHDRLETISATEAVVRVLAPTPDGTVDLYFYVRRDAEGWRVSAMRSLALSGLAYALRDQLRASASLTDEQTSMLRNLDLVLSSDAALRQWFEAHREALDDLARTALASGASGQSDAVTTALGLTSIQAEDGAVRVLVGGVLDNTVGFLRPGSDGEPPISPSEYIWVEDLGGGWFLYRTT